MAGVRELRGRIKSVGNIKQITRAMEMVATTKLRRFQDRAVASRPYTEEITRLIQSLSEMLGPEQIESQPLFRDGEGEGTLLLLVTSDRGLCGAYNSNLFRRLEQKLAQRTEADGPVRFYVIGRKGYQYLTKSGREIEHYLHEPALENMDYASAAATARRLTDAFLKGEVRNVEIFYTAFESMVSYVPRAFQLLPLQFEREEGESASSVDVILEPDAETIFDSILPRYVETRIFNALLEALTSEFASRRVSMKNATDAATDMQGELKSQYNRLRQETITKELLDIVGGAEALR